jgi:hypothetical protein
MYCLRKNIYFFMGKKFAGLKNSITFVKVKTIRYAEYRLEQDNDRSELKALFCWGAPLPR